MNREKLRALALELLATPHEEPPARRREMVPGAWRLVDEFESNGRRYFVVAAVMSGALLSDADIGLLRKRAHGCSVKEIAIEAGLSESTVSRRLRHAMGTLGISGQPQLARLWVALAGASDLGSLAIGALADQRRASSRQEP